MFDLTWVKSQWVSGGAGSERGIVTALKKGGATHCYCRY